MGRFEETDILVIGSEGAGARAALEAAERGLRVLVASKGVIGKSGATLTSGADVSVDSRSAIELFGLPGNPEDSPERFAEDMCRESGYISNQALVKIHCEEAPARIRELADWGLKISHLTQAPGHQYPRGLWVAGTEFPKVFASRFKKQDRVSVLDNFMVTDLLTHKGRVAGACGLRVTTGEFLAVKARAVIICAGGAMRIYPHATAPDELTGDGMAMALRAGAALVDMEFPMFLPYTMIKPASIDGLDFTYSLLTYLEGHALNRLGERYMKHWDPERMERSTRDINSVAAMMQVLEGKGSPNGGTYVSLAHIPQNLLEYSAEWFPSDMSGWRYSGFNMRNFLPDLTKEAVETAPAAHFWNGGIRINEKCETSLPGLFAAGEGTGGLMGANRISGNALTMTQVWGRRAGVYAAQYAQGCDDVQIEKDQTGQFEYDIESLLTREKGYEAVRTRRDLQKLAWESIGVIREESGLTGVLGVLADMKRNVLPNIKVSTTARACNREWVEAIQLRNMALIIEAVALSSLERTESRGALYRCDHTKTDNLSWLKNIVLEKRENGLSTRQVGANILYHKPEAGVFRYGYKG